MQKYLKLPIGFVVLLLFAVETSAQTESGVDHSLATDQVASRIDDYLKQLVDENRFMGSIMITQKGETIIRKAYGFRAMNRKLEVDPADEESSYRIGSISKTFTAVLIVQLAESGKLSLDDKLSKYFPKMSNADEITLDQLLRHRSGLKSITSTLSYPLWAKSPQTREEMIERMEKLPSKFKPDSKTEYSNTNFILLGYIVEKVTGKTYREVLSEQILEPLEMKRTFFEPPTKPENVARSFTRSTSWVPIVNTHQSVPHGAGAVMSTPTDLTKFMQGLFNGKLISNDALKVMTDTSKGNGQGIMRVRFCGKSGLGHGGAIDGFRANVGYLKRDDVVFAICGNGTTVPLKKLTEGVLQHLFEDPEQEKANPKDGSNK